jgi:toxin YoeB
MYIIKYEKLALKQLKNLNDNKKYLKKIETILEEISIDPYSTTHKFERLKYNLSGTCSKRLDKKNRILYRVVEQEIIVIIISVSGHYE